MFVNDTLCRVCKGKKHIPDPNNSGCYIRCECMIINQVIKIMLDAGIPDYINSDTWKNIVDNESLKSKDFKRLNRYADDVCHWQTSRSIIKTEWLYNTQNEEILLDLGWQLLFDYVYINKGNIAVKFITLRDLVESQFDNNNRGVMYRDCESVGMLMVHVESSFKHSYAGIFLNRLVKYRFRNRLATIVVSRDLLSSNKDYNNDVRSYFQNKNYVNKTVLKDVIS